MNNTENDEQTQKKPTAQTPTRERILKAAFQLFLQHGYEGTGLSQIVGSSGVSKGAFYHYFASKHQIYREVVEAFFLVPFEQFDPANIAELSPKKAKSVLRKYYTAMPQMVSASTNQELVQYFALLFDSLSRIPEFREKVRILYANILRTLTKSIANSKSPKKRDKRKARRFLAGLEGEIYLQAVLKKST